MSDDMANDSSSCESISVSDSDVSIEEKTDIKETKSQHHDDNKRKQEINGDQQKNKEQADTIVFK